MRMKRLKVLATKVVDKGRQTTSLNSVAWSGAQTLVHRPDGCLSKKHFKISPVVELYVFSSSVRL